MNAEVIRELLRRQPFQPFEIRMSNVESHRVGHPENAFLAGNRFIVYYPETDRMVILPSIHAVSLEVLQGGLIVVVCIAPAPNRGAWRALRKAVE